MSFPKFKVHGTYPWSTGEWELVKRLTSEEVATLLNLERGPKIDGESMFDAEYLWLNKGYVVLGAPEESGVNSKSAPLLEAMLNGPIPGLDIPIGAQAIYIADGKYLLIEKKEKLTRERVRKARSHG